MEKIEASCPVCYASFKNIENTYNEGSAIECDHCGSQFRWKADRAGLLTILVDSRNCECDPKIVNIPVKVQTPEPYPYMYSLRSMEPMD